MPRRLAIDLALEAHGRPEAIAFAGVAPLPDGIKTVMRIAADGEWRDAATIAAYARLDARSVREACATFLCACLFRGTGDDPYRILGLAAKAPAREVREHKRLLLKWLHPDRNSDPRQQAFMKLVVEAAERIEKGEAGLAAGRASGSTAGSPVRGPSGRAAGAAAGGKPRAGAQKPQRLRRAAAQALHAAMSGLRRAAWATATAIAALAAWRFVMHEPIGQSVQRYSEAALGLIRW